jgi:hypothetical protein
MTIAQQLKIKEFPFIIKDNNGKEIYSEASNGYWWKREYNDKGNEIYCEDSNGVIKDKRLKPCEDKIIEMDGVKYKLVKL